MHAEHLIAIEEPVHLARALGRHLHHAITLCEDRGSMLRHFHGIWRARPDVRFEPGEVFADRLEMPRVNVVRLSRYAIAST